MKPIIYFCLVIFALFAGGALAIDGIPPFPKKAFKIEDHTVRGSNTMQAALRLKSQYPGSGILSHYYAGVSEHWQACRSKTRGWISYIDKSSGKPRQVHQVIRYWVNPDDRKMLSVIVRHYSDGKKMQCTPDNDVQYGTVVVSHSPELEKEMILLKLSCGLDSSLSVLSTVPPAPCSN